MIECSLRELGEYGSLLPDRDKRKRQGKYHGSEFYNIVVDYGVKKCSCKNYQSSLPF